MSTIREVNTTKAAFLLNISAARLRLLLKQGRVRGARKVGRFWLIPLYGGMPQISEGTRGPQGKWRQGKACASTMITVNRRIIAYNQENHTNIPPFSVREGRKVTYCHLVEIGELLTLVYRPDQPNVSGATAWFECPPSVVVKKRLFEPYDPNLLRDIKAGKYNTKKSKDKSKKSKDKSKK